MNEEAMKAYIAEQLSQTEHRISQTLERRMAEIENAFQYIAKVLEESGVPINLLVAGNKQWTECAAKQVAQIARTNTEYKSAKSVMAAAVKHLRDNYGVPVEQLRKDYRYKYGLDSMPSILDAIGDDKVVREIFDSILYEMSQPKSRPDITLDGEEETNVMIFPVKPIEQTRAEQMKELVKQVALKYGDETRGYLKTHRMIYSQMDCAWNNLATRYKKANNAKATPSKPVIIVNNDRVFRKFKKVVENLLSA